MARSLFENRCSASQAVSLPCTGYALSRGLPPMVRQVGAPPERAQGDHAAPGDVTLAVDTSRSAVMMPKRCLQQLALLLNVRSGPSPRRRGDRLAAHVADTHVPADLTDSRYLCRVLGACHEARLSIRPNQTASAPWRLPKEGDSHVLAPAVPAASFAAPAVWLRRSLSAHAVVAKLTLTYSVLSTMSEIYIAERRTRRRAAARALIARLHRGVGCRVHGERAFDGADPSCFRCRVRRIESSAGAALLASGGPRGFQHRESTLLRRVGGTYRHRDAAARRSVAPPADGTFQRDSTPRSRPAFTLHLESADPDDEATVARLEFEATDNSTRVQLRQGRSRPRRDARCTGTAGRSRSYKLAELVTSSGSDRGCGRASDRRSSR